MNPVTRRTFLVRSATTVLSASVGGSVLAACSTTETSQALPADVSPIRHRYAFEGAHQVGIVTPAQEHAIIVAFDVVVSDAPALQAMFETLTKEIRDLMAGLAAPALDPLEPPADNLIVGVDPPAADLTITAAVGASLFDDRYGLVDLKPKQLIQMPEFPNDKPDVTRLHGDLLIQICASTPAMCNHVLRRVMRATRSSLVLKWLLPGFNTPNQLGPGRASGRNLLGFKDGTANPDSEDEPSMNDLVWIGPGTHEPMWTVGGSYQVVRLIRNRVEFWDRTPLRTQETIIGREKNTGAPVGMQNETDSPDFSLDPGGSTFGLHGHIRLANPRTPQTQRNRILRRGFNYSTGFDAAGQLDQGLLFVCFQRSLDDGFVAVQNRLDGEALEEYITPFGGGYFFALPGVTRGSDNLADGLFARPGSGA